MMILVLLIYFIYFDKMVFIFQMICTFFLIICHFSCIYLMS
uniref:Uncharacterized protein n=1 Tax=Bostrychia simpliciuscula TaxID=324754 RepID=A0A1Z1M7H3_9FLOR|nr:hypothetical protein [Bostrychia simpliciuscula]ARW62038.1 hypothetical protein [Bostrychia simpliciuscula]